MHQRTEQNGFDAASKQTVRKQCSKTEHVAHGYLYKNHIVKNRTRDDEGE